ncbi:hypothetical protein B0H14DRAFT_3163688 [Mycena olivaceomarginata]|nr:hypothetical protein B0H14DRAFT_3163688 [Mycena olivaceomarginata]
MDSFSSRHHTTILGSIGGSGGQGLGGGIGGAGGNAEGPRFNVSGAKNWNVMVHGPGPLPIDLITVAVRMRRTATSHGLPSCPSSVDQSGHVLLASLVFKSTLSVGILILSSLWIPPLVPVPCTELKVALTHGDLRVSSEARDQSLAMMQKHHKICPLPVSSFNILQEMHQHFDCDQGSRHIFVLHASGVQEKVSFHSSFCRTPKPTIGMIKPPKFCKCVTLISSFSENADDVQLDISKFFPHCTFGNILITTHNQELCIHAGASSRVSDRLEAVSGTCERERERNIFRAPKWILNALVWKESKALRSAALRADAGEWGERGDAQGEQHRALSRPTQLRAGKPTLSMR